MIFNQTSINGAYTIELEKIGDSRGFFARQFCRDEFAREGLVFNLAQASISFTGEKGTLRGMHYQLPPSEEIKLVRCLRGEIWDCVLDIRAESPTFGKWFGTTLSDKNRVMMAIPKGCAHGFLSLTANCELLYLMDTPYDKKAERGLRWNDPQFGIRWPTTPQIISERDQRHPDFSTDHR